MKLFEVNYLRAYAIISIVIWHCFVCPLSVWNLIEPTMLTKVTLALSRFVIPDANMPLFTFISGYLFSYLYHKGTIKYQNFRPFFKTKLERLVIPFLVIGTLVNISMPERYLYQILSGEGSHLWFCMMLFWCFMIRWVVLKINMKSVRHIMILFSIAAIVYSKGSNWNLPEFPFSIFGIRHAVYFYFYFVLGDLFYYNKDKINNVVNGKSNSRRLHLITVMYLVWVVFSFLKIRYISGLLYISTSAFFIILFYLWVTKIMGTYKLKSNKFIDRVCTYSFGIYVFHEWISWGVYHQPFFFGMFVKYTFVYAAVFTILDFTISFTLTHYALKTKIGKYLLL